MKPKKMILPALALLSVHSLAVHPLAFGATENCPTCNLVSGHAGAVLPIKASPFNLASFLDRASAPSPASQLLGQMEPQRVAPQAVAGFADGLTYQVPGFMTGQPNQASSTNWSGSGDLQGVDFGKAFDPTFKCSFWNSNTGFVNSPMAPWNLVLPPEEASAFFNMALALTGTVQES